MRVGIDLVKANRFKNKSESFFEKYFTQAEVQYSKTRKNFEESIAGIFACKEAFLKAIGIGVFKGITLKEVQVLHENNGAPFLTISQKVKKQYKIKNCAVSISHDNGYCVAICTIN